MKLAQLYQNGQRMLATDGRMYIDGRFNLQSAIQAVRDRNSRFKKNFPHKIADAFEYKGRIINI